MYFYVQKTHEMKDYEMCTGRLAEAATWGLFCEVQ